MKKNNLVMVLSYLAIYIVWGSTYFFIKWAVETIPPFYLVSLRFLFGGIVFLIISILTGKIKEFPKMNEFLSAVFLGTFLLLLGNGFISWAEKKVDSYLTALIISSTPFCIALFNWSFFREKLSWVRLVGMILGVSGVGLILYSGNNSFKFSFYLSLVLAGFLSWSFATSVGHRLKVHPNNLVNSAIQMIYVGIAAFILSIFLYKPLPSVMPGISPRSWIGLIYLTIFGGIAYYAYNYLLNHEPAIRISTYSIINPMIAVILGVFIEKEEPLPLLFLGMPIILAGMILMLYGETILSIFKKNIIKKALEKDEAFDKKIAEE